MNQTDEIKVTIRPGRVDDQGRILGLLDQARHQVAGFGSEDLPQLLSAHEQVFLIADTGALLWGFMVASLLPQPVRPGEAAAEWATLRGCGFINGWRLDTALPALWEPLRRTLRAQHVQQVMHIATNAWIAAPLRGLGFSVNDYLITYERGVGLAHTGEGMGRARIRAAHLAEIDTVAALDSAAFERPWRFSRGDLISFSLTSGHFAVAEADGGIVGYAISDVRQDVGQIARLAVHPAAQRQGIGRQLLTDAVSFCRRGGASTVLLNTQDSNDPSRRLYERNGFRAVGGRVPVLAYRIQAA